jgi:hypothetical protein
MGPLFDAKLKSESKEEEAKRLTRTLQQLTSFFPFEVTTLLNNERDLKKYFDHSNKVRSARLGDIFENFSSDKKIHGYHVVYQAVIDEVLLSTSSINLLEIGIGTNNLNIKSNMGTKGNPGASLRSFREFIPRSKIYGADIDSRILFEEDRIKTFYVDQLSEISLNNLMLEVGKCEILIDDGLHTSEANLLTFSSFIQHVAVGGWIIIEDIDGAQENLLIWNTVSIALKESFSCYLVECENAYLFLAKRVF